MKVEEPGPFPGLGDGVLPRKINLPLAELELVPEVRIDTGRSDSLIGEFLDGCASFFFLFTFIASPGKYFQGYEWQENLFRIYMTTLRTLTLVHPL